MPGHYQSGMGVMPQLTMVPVDPATGVHLQPAIQPFIPNPASSMQWPYYPQSGEYKELLKVVIITSFYVVCNTVLQYSL